MEARFQGLGLGLVGTYGGGNSSCGGCGSEGRRESLGFEEAWWMGLGEEGSGMEWGFITDIEGSGEATFGTIWDWYGETD